VRVRDQGIGVALEDQERIFRRFGRAVSERHYGGFGIGLWMARQAARALGGEISVESRRGAGATFTVRLPRSGPPVIEAEEPIGSNGHHRAS
jgi:signal transduction histidine kinase